MVTRSVSERSRLRVLAVASEAGSAKAVVPVLACLGNRGVDLHALLPTEVLALANMALPEVGWGKVAAALHGQPVEEAVASRPDVILAGTTARASLERELVVHGRKHGIPTLSVVDERYGYRRRFADEGGHLEYLPDLVVVMDDGCSAAAVAEGIPAERLRVTGSPILSFLACHYADRRPDVEADLFRKLPGWKRVTFISETLARDNGSTPGEGGRLGPFLGFTEETVRRDLLTVLQEVGHPTILLERLHPSDDMHPMESQAGPLLIWRQLKGGDLWPLLMESDVVIGMRSMALLEAALLGRHVASYQPNLIGEDRCAAVCFGVAAALRTCAELKTWLMRSLSAASAQVERPKDLPFIRLDAAERAADLVLKLGKAR
ncbi:MAG: hypothetical protein A3G80_01045 [Betaproteobacteria bacterium RIFCSPLOWO2_12_FULL_62_13b]|nr:MAG: hypothetical protein A3G80_01045 [Betaproteobacteria bacterium RIFCSPLOWO2_12_FULL_62_13b]